MPWFLACLLFLGFGGANFAVYTLWLPEQYPTECRGSAFAFATSFGRFLAAGITFLVGAAVARMQTIGTPVALTSVAFLVGISLLPLARRNQRQAVARMTLTHLFDLSLTGRRDRAGARISRPRVSPSAKSTRAATAWRMLWPPADSRAGDRLCVYLANCVEMIDLYLACVKLGVIFVPINILYREREMCAHPAATPSPACSSRRTTSRRA